MVVLRLVCTLACVGVGAGLTAPGGVLRAPRPAMRAQQRFAIMSGVEEEAMSEAEFLAMSEGEVLSEEEFVATAAEPKPEELSPEAQRVYRGMRSSTGVEFAPWMKVDAEKVAAAKKAREERMARAAQGATQDQLQIDPQAAETAGGGLKSKTLSEEEVELRWSTGDETGNAGFIVQRRPGGSQNFDDIASYESFAPLRSKGVTGGDYVYLDDTIPNPGTFVYRILDCDVGGTRSAICQKLVEIESQSEQTQTLVVGVIGLVLAVAGFVAGTALDPMQTTDKGGSFF